jgi:acetolactate synthase-1/2/3 large subunit
MKLSDHVADFLARQGIRHVFAISGGASLHLIHGVANHPDIDYICPQHEQAAAMAADAYARVTGNIGAAIATSGPGATNLITGICCAFYDSVPVLYITGQVATFRLSRGTGARQVGFQETDVVGICKPITKYAVMVEEPGRIRYELEKAAWIARSDRPGPVLVDIPDNLQREDIDPTALEGFVPPPPSPQQDLAPVAARCCELIAASKRPIAILGWGNRLAHAEGEALAFVRRFGLPTLLTWGTLDLMPADDPLFVGSFGTHGTRYGNFAAQNADLVISIGSRLDTHSVGSPFSDFARGAVKVIVDIDPAELAKFARFGMNVDLPLVADAKAFLQAMNAAPEPAAQPDIEPWFARIRDWKRRYAILEPRYRRQTTLNPYVFVKALSDAAAPGDVIFVDTGCAVAWMSQGFAFKPGQRYFHAFNNTPMGYALPGAIGASIARGRSKVICVTGDGGLQVNIQELATVIRHALPIKIFLLNNHGYSMIQQTQDQWLNSRYIASSVEGGLAFPDFEKVAGAYGFPTVTLRTNDDADSKLGAILAADGPCFVNVELLAEERVSPQVKFGRPIEDAEPLLPRTEFFENMIVEPVAASRR